MPQHHNRGNVPLWKGERPFCQTKGVGEKASIIETRGISAYLRTLKKDDAMNWPAPSLSSSNHQSSLTYPIGNGKGFKTHYIVVPLFIPRPPRQPHEKNDA